MSLSGLPQTFPTSRRAVVVVSAGSRNPIAAAIPVATRTRKMINHFPCHTHLKKSSRRMSPSKVACFSSVITIKASGSTLPLQHHHILEARGSLEVAFDVFAHGRVLFGCKHFV